MKKLSIAFSLIIFNVFISFHSVFAEDEESLFKSLPLDVLEAVSKRLDISSYLKLASVSTRMHLSLLENPDFISSYIRTLDLKVLMDGLSSSDEFTRKRSVGILRAFKLKKPEYLSRYLSLLENPDPEIRNAGASVLEVLAPLDNETAKKLVLSALGKYRNSCEVIQTPAFSVLTKTQSLHLLLLHAPESERYTAIQALRESKTTQPEVISAYSEAILDPDISYARISMQALRNLRIGDAEVVERLITAMGSPVLLRGEAALDALLVIQPDLTSYREKLTDYLFSDLDSARICTSILLLSADRQDPLAYEALSELANSNSHLKQSAQVFINRLETGQPLIDE